MQLQAKDTIILRCQRAPIIRQQKPTLTKCLLRPGLCRSFCSSSRLGRIRAMWRCSQHTLQAPPMGGPMTSAETGCHALPTSLKHRRRFTPENINDSSRRLTLHPTVETRVPRCHRGISAHTALRSCLSTAGHWTNSAPFSN